MNSRERVVAALEHKEPDLVPLDLGGSAVTGMSVISVYLLRQALGLDSPGTPVKVIEPYQMLGEIKPDLLDALGVDVVGLTRRNNLFGFENSGWKPWEFHRVPVLVPGAFNIEPEPNGELLMYPEGDHSAPPSGRMPCDGYYFDTIIRQPPLDEKSLKLEDNLEEFGPLSDEDLRHLKNETERISAGSERAILANFGGTGFGDIALVPAPWLKNPKGIRDVAEWYMATASQPEYVYKIFEAQCSIALENLPRIFDVVGNKPTIVFISGTDFGTQAGPFISPKTYRRLYKPFHIELNNWVHTHTTWKTFIHSCGSVAALIPEFIEAGFEVLNPVQTSATGMDSAWLKRQYGHDLTFWGGGVDTQHTLPFATPAEIRTQVAERIRTFGPGGGFVFNTIHNLQARIPAQNIVALYQAFKEYRSYPLA